MVTNTAFVQVGINYTESGRPLKGCVNDANDFRGFLMCRFYAFHIIRTSTSDMLDSELGLQMGEHSSLDGWS